LDNHVDNFLVRQNCELSKQKQEKMKRQVFGTLLAEKRALHSQCPKEEIIVDDTSLGPIPYENKFNCSMFECSIISGQKNFSNADSGIGTSGLSCIVSKRDLPFATVLAPGLYRRAGYGCMLYS
jgi:hypothetical protein